MALAGYTNVGKSTLLNALTGAEVSVENRLFETLDPTTRGFDHDGKRYLVTDTVGFIRRLPTQLVEGFASTLEETLVADLVLHVVDASASDERLDEMIDSVETVLHEIGADDVPVELVLNKIDLVDPLGRRRLANRFPGAAAGRGRDRRGARELRERIAERFCETATRTYGCCCRTTRARSSPSSTRSARRSRSGRTAGTACSSAPGCRGGTCAGSRATSLPTAAEKASVIARTRRAARGRSRAGRHTVCPSSVRLASAEDAPDSRALLVAGRASLQPG